MRPAIHVAGLSPLAASLRLLLADAAADGPAMLVNADLPGDAAAVIARCEAYAAAVPAGTEAVIVTVMLEPPAGLADLVHHTANAALGAFTRQAALEWAKRGIRVNAIGLGGGAAEADIVRTVLAIRAWASMTGQVVWLGNSKKGLLF